jgi:hypothetical protein
LPVPSTVYTPELSLKVPVAVPISDNVRSVVAGQNNAAGFVQNRAVGFVQNSDI